MPFANRRAKKIEFAYDIYIGAPITNVWKGIVGDGEMTKHYFT